MAFGALSSQTALTLVQFRVPHASLSIARFHFRAEPEIALKHCRDGPTAPRPFLSMDHSLLGRTRCLTRHASIILQWLCFLYYSAVTLLPVLEGCRFSCKREDRKATRPITLEESRPSPGPISFNRSHDSEPSKFNSFLKWQPPDKRFYTMNPQIFKIHI